VSARQLVRARLAVARAWPGPVPAPPWAGLGSEKHGPQPGTCPASTRLWAWHVRAGLARSGTGRSPQPARPLLRHLTPYHSLHGTAHCPLLPPPSHRPLPHRLPSHASPLEIKVFLRFSSMTGSNNFIILIDKLNKFVFAFTNPSKKELILSDLCLVAIPAQKCPPDKYLPNVFAICTSLPTYYLLLHLYHIFTLSLSNISRMCLYHETNTKN